MMGTQQGLNDSSLKICKFCFGTEDDSQLTFVHPCRCKGTIHWVHNQCLEMWFTKANSVQKLMCVQCKTKYQKQMTLKTWRFWKIPKLNLSFWGFVEVSIDLWMTWRTVLGFVEMMNGTKGILRELILCSMWKCFVASDRRFCFYGSLMLNLASSIFDIAIDDYDQRREIRAQYRKEIVSGVPGRNMLREQFQKLYFVISQSPVNSFEAIAAIVIPLILVAVMFNWRVKQSMKKQKQIRKRREKLLKRLNGTGKEETTAGENDPVIAEAIRLMEEKTKKSK
ncbi:unnamed protein product [Caenorhabditis sp. 36 PRJEB53466]|nr:unnamed protein product [Caenorhabditis sp. 36 PRJEB53466]